MLSEFAFHLSQHCSQDMLQFLLIAGFPRYKTGRHAEHLHHRVCDTDRLPSFGKKLACGLQAVVEN